jgi:hypothetical protein
VQQTVVQPVHVINSSPVDVYVPVAVPVNVYVPVNPHRPEKPERPSTTYWGFGGQLRPDAWGQSRSREPEKDRREPDRDRTSDDREPPAPARRR